MLSIVGRLRRAAHKLYATHHSRHKYVGVGRRLKLLRALITMTEGYREELHSRHSSASPFSLRRAPHPGDRNCALHRTDLIH